MAQIDSLIALPPDVRMQRILSLPASGTVRIA